MSLDTSASINSTTSPETYTSDVRPTFNQDVIDWMRTRRAAGDTDETLLDKLLKAGWDTALARQAVNLPVSAMAAEPPVPLPQAPGPDLSGLPNSLDLGDCRVQVLMNLTLPRAVLFANFLSDYECDTMIAAAKARGLKRSKTVSNDEDCEQIVDIRTSEGMFFTRGETEWIQRLETRISRLLNWPVSHGEGFQVLHYGSGNKYEPHYDYFQPTSPATPRHLKRGGQRVGTLIMYLEDTEAGGGTVFPKANLSIQPRKGNALFFGYDRPDPATLTLHGGAPVLAGEKWIATKWLREREYV